MTIKNQFKKSGIVSLVGRSNVGKSTLLNALVGFKVSAVSPKAQTTRWAAKGVYNDERGQIVFVDTPGLFIDVPNALTKAVNKEVKESLRGIDLLVYVVDPTREIRQEEQRLLAMVRSIENKILVINKTDLPKLKYIYDYEALSDDFKATLKVSAKRGTHLKSLINEIFEYLSEAELMYPEDVVHEQSFQDWAAEIIREKVFHHVHQEIPYSVHVEVDEVKLRQPKSMTPLDSKRSKIPYRKSSGTTSLLLDDRRGLSGARVAKRKDGTLYIKARVLTSEDKYRPMLIGKKASKLKDIGSAARAELELVMQQKIFLDLEVEVDPHWLERV